MGKKTAKEWWAEVPVEEYTKRLAPMVALTCDYLKDDDSLLRAIRSIPSGQWRIALDERGSMYTSEEFSANLFRRMDNSGGRIALFVGGADGLSSEAKASVDQTISLSGLTFTHK